MTRNVESNSVLDTCRHLGILLVAYSPVCRGLLAALDFDPARLTEGDFRRQMPRFTPTHFSHNQQLAMALQQVATDEGISPAQVALAWVLSRAPNIVPIPGTRSSARLDENLRALDVTLSEEAQQRLAEVFKPHAAAGLRYTAESMKAYGLQE